MSWNWMRHLYKAHPDPLKRYLGGFNTFMRPGSSSSCMRGEIMTPQEEYDFTHKMLAAIEQRPEDWSFGTYTATDKKTNLTLWISNGEAFCRLYRPEVVLRRGSQFRIFRALHKLRHNVRTGKGKEIIEKLDSAAPKNEVKHVEAVKNLALIVTNAPEQRLLENAVERHRRPVPSRPRLSEGI